MRKRVAVILSRFPYPLDKGDKLRAFHQLKYLSQYHDIYLYSLHTEPIGEEAFKKIKPFCKEICLYNISYFSIFKGVLFSLLNKYPIQVGYFFSGNIRKKIAEDISTKEIETVYCQLSRTALYAKDFKGHKVIDFQDAFSVNYKRLSENTSGIYRMFYKREYSTMLAFEQKMLSWFDSCTIISAFDKTQIPGEYHKIEVVPNGVDTDYFSLKSKGLPAQLTKKYDLVFVGNLSYLPNKNAVFYLVKNIYPLLKKLSPDITINIAGADTPREIYDLANEHITVSGFVKDIRDVYAEARIFAAPLFTGAGLQNKILEAMAMEVPCITTAVVNSSLNAREDQHLLIANNEQEFVAKIISLLTSEDVQAEMSREARNFVKENYSWEKANQKLKALL